ncbi:MAG: metallophosphoesterase family protein, partial [Akkermansiaceae bacterium]|nr:metallophosphoesterase family protein [Armatimonadota bacterium]
MILAASPLIAQEAKTAAKKVADGVAHRPTGIPDRIILTFKGDPARAIGVTWRTDNTVLPGEATVQIAEATAYPNFEEKARVVAATSTPVATDLGPAHFHGAEVTGLTPNTLYAYRVGDGANWSEWIHFRTASDKPEPFTFIYFGDAQNDIKSLWSRAIRSAYSDAPKARFMIHAGDLINNANTDAQWGEWHTAGGWVNAMMPSLPSPGNHEYNGMPKSLSGHWRPQFTLPENGPAGLEETCYYVDYQGVRIISLNTEEQTDAQVPWLDKVLADNPNRWTVLTFHRPIFSSAKGRDNKVLREAWMPIFDKHKVDLVLQGHDHTYARSKNIRAG